ncbi:glycosyl hydrolase family 28 protein [Bacillus sp. Marseille-P3800]|uniref:glycosyl hydrolase family 28 protein n=1 Tax=Bacillus sp. Marseille-P3800 TaxID=2014782 RepID=UPI001145DA86|nr:glycosyl hydrolase family 28 protein [Bacillus sp. Marseille-P3800]
MIPSNTTLGVVDPHGGSATINQNEGNMNPILLTDRDKDNSNISINNLVFDANYYGHDDPIIQKENHTIFLKSVNGLTLNNIIVKNSIAWAVNIHSSNDIKVVDFDAYSTGDQQDGLHLVDSNNVYAKNVRGNTGDDVLGVTVDHHDFIENYKITNVKGSSQIGSLVRLNQSDRSYELSERKVIRNMEFTNLEGYDLGNRGFSVADIHPNSKVENIRVHGKFYRVNREGILFTKGENIHVNAELRNHNLLSKGYSSFKSNELNNSFIKILNLNDPNEVLIENGNGNIINCN